MQCNFILEIHSYTYDRSSGLSNHADISSKLDDMTDNVSRLLKSFRTLNQNLKPESTGNDTAEHIINMETCVRSAGTLLSSATTLLGSGHDRTSQLGSECGDELSAQHRRQIESWIPEPTITEENEETSHFDSDPVNIPSMLPVPDQNLPRRASSAFTPVRTSLTRKPVAATKQQTSPIHDSLSNIDLYLIESLIKFANAKVTEKDYSGARKVLDRILKEARVTYRTQWKWRDEVLRMCAVTYCQLGLWADADLVLNQEFVGKHEEIATMATEFCFQDKLDHAKRLLMRKFEQRDKIMELYAKRAYWGRRWEEAQEALSTVLTSQQDERDLDRLRFMHALAEVYWTRGARDTAWEWCMKAMDGRKEVLGESHVLYYQSVSLLALICKSRKDLVEAARYDALLPEGFKGMILVFEPELTWRRLCSD